MGKWSDLKGKVTQFVQPITWQQKIDVVKQKHAGVSFSALSFMYAENQSRKEALKDQLSEINTEEEALNQMMLESFESQDVTQVKNDLGTFYIIDDPYSSVEDRVAYLKWVKTNHLEELLQVNYQTTSGIVRERLQAGEPLPDGIKVYLKSSVGFRRTKK